MKINENIKKDLVKIFSKIKKKNLSLHEPFFFGNEKKYLIKCITSNSVASNGNFKNILEDKLKKFTKSKYCILVSSGTAALHVGLEAMGVKKNDEVLIPNLNYIASANASLYLNAIPHFINIDEKTLGIDVEELEMYLKKNTIIKKKKLFNKKTKNYIKAIVPVHLFGYPCQIDKIIKLSKKYKIKVLEDAAEALGTYFDKKHVGTFGNVGVISFNGNKIITTGGGGAVITNDLNIAKKIRKLTNVSKAQHPWRMRFEEKGYNYKMPNLNAALGASQMETINKILKFKKINYNKYKVIFDNNKYFEVYKGINKSTPNHWLVTLLIKKNYIQYKDLIIKFLISKKIGVRPAWDTMTSTKYLKNFPAMKPTIDNQIVKRIINLPSSAFLHKFFK